MTTKAETNLVRDIRVTLRGKLGGLWIKQHGSMYAQQGVPDLIGCVEGVFIGLEVKMPGKEDEVTPLQQETMDQINAEGGYATMVTSEEEALTFVRASLGYDEYPKAKRSRG